MGERKLQNQRQKQKPFTQIHGTPRQVSTDKRWTVPEDYVAHLQEKASEYFFKDGQTGLIYDMNVQDAIRNKYKDQLEAKPEGIYRRFNGTWEVAPPRFIRKEGQRIFWASRFTILANGYKLVPQKPGEYFGTSVNVITGETSATPVKIDFRDVGSGLGAIGRGSLAGSYGGGPVLPEMVNLSTLLGNERLAATGKTTVDVNWSVSVNVKGVFSKPTIDSIEFVETVWENVP